MNINFILSYYNEENRIKGIKLLKNMDICIF